MTPRLTACVVMVAVYFICAVAVLAECNPVVNTLSTHFTHEVPKNERNFGLGVECGRWQVGAYHNSEWRLTTYAFYGLPLTHVGPVAMGVAAGAATGYEYAPVVPMLGITLRWGVVRLFITPPYDVGGKNTGVIASQLVLPFNF